MMEAVAEQQRIVLQGQISEAIGGVAPTTCYALSFFPKKAEPFIAYQIQAARNYKLNRFHFKNEVDGDFRYAIPEALDCYYLEQQIMLLRGQLKEKSMVDYYSRPANLELLQHLINVYNDPHEKEYSKDEIDKMNMRRILLNKMGVNEKEIGNAQQLLETQIHFNKMDEEKRRLQQLTEENNRNLGNAKGDLSDAQKLITDSWPKQTA
jgi:hypothetical protein